MKITMRKRVTLNDGTSLSVQAGSMHYSLPREDDVAAYSKVEVGSVEPCEAIPDSWAEWAEEGDGADWKKNPCLIFAYMPASTLFDFIMEHGGIASGEIPPLAFFGEPSMD